MSEPEKQVNSGQWKKGQSGNPKGRPRKGSSFAEILREIGEQEYKDDMSRMEAMSYKLWSEASKGHQWAITALMDRIDGKPKQIVDQTTRNVNVSIDGEDAEAYT